MFKVWVSIERQPEQEAEAFARTIGWTPFNENTAYERGE
jgi:hypothetical protein